MSVEEIQSTLLKNHNASSITQARKESQLSQIMPSAVWQGLVLDLLLGNIEQETVWGWAAPETLLLLDMWHQLDEQTMFLLVYQSPAAALQQAFTHQEDINPDECLDNWAAYHGAMLAFYLRHPERCVLANTQQLLSQPEALLKAMPGISAQQAGVPAIPSAKSEPLANALAALGSEAEKQHESLKAAPLEDFLSNQMASHHPAQTVYEELQSSALLPAENTQAVTEQDAWQYFGVHQLALGSIVNFFQQTLDDEKTQKNALEKENSELKESVTKASGDNTQQLEEKSLLIQQLHMVQEELEDSITQKNALEKENSELKESVANAAGANAKQLEENNQLIQQLHMLQEKLEKGKTQKSALEKENSELKESVANAAGANTQQLEEENSLLLQQLHLVQEELEKLYTSGKASQASYSPSNSYYGADERIKHQLSYRLGAVVVNSHNITDFIFLPFALKRAHSAYKKDMKARKGEQLPPIAHYADAHKADQVKQHLSYRLGQVIMANAGSPIGWFRLPFALSREAKAFRRERQR
ncbi:hypothetical protein LG277_03305 [Vreelandella aquamarina]|uniref:hypothetical protein n=1 Tax=Vreelandella aquamarina TaxID=77097 RepID=UPI00384F1CEE